MSLFVTSSLKFYMLVNFGLFSSRQLLNLQSRQSNANFGSDHLSVESSASPFSRCSGTKPCLPGLPSLRWLCTTAVSSSISSRIYMGQAQKTNHLGRFNNCPEIRFTMRTMNHYDALVISVIFKEVALDR